MSGELGHELGQIAARLVSSYAHPEDCSPGFDEF
jgi:hypothetical protein